ncbi:protein DMP6-like [Nymphaea colorata]|nr:protein DMP6-like [Nymphaea colorata]
MAKMAVENQDLESQRQYPYHQSCTFYRKEENEQLFLVQKAVNRAFKSSANLKNLLPTGTVLAFQVLSPILSNEGECDRTSRLMTAGLVALCGLSCFLLCFTDSFKGIDGEVFHGIATPRGLWVLDAHGSSRNGGLEPEKAFEFRVRFIDFIHAFASALVFAAVAALDHNVVACFCPEPSTRARLLLVSVPLGVGFLCSMLFVAFPTTRHGIGFHIN